MIVTLGDVPTITPVVLARFLGAAPRTRATYGGSPGHPVVLGRAHLNEVTGLSGDRGLRDLVAGGPTIECGTLSSGRGVDSRYDLQAISRYSAAGRLGKRGDGDSAPISRSVGPAACGRTRYRSVSRLRDEEASAVADELLPRDLR